MSEHADVGQRDHKGQSQNGSLPTRELHGWVSPARETFFDLVTNLLLIHPEQYLAKPFDSGGRSDGRVWPFLSGALLGGAFGRTILRGGGLFAGEAARSDQPNCKQPP